MLPEFRNGAAWNSCLDANADDQDSKPRLPVALSLAWHVWPLRPQDRAMCPFYTDHGVEYTEHDKPAAWCDAQHPSATGATAHFRLLVKALKNHFCDFALLWA